MKKFTYLLIVFLFVTLLLQSNAANAGVASDEAPQPAPEATDSSPGTKPSLVGGKIPARPVVIAGEPSASLNSTTAPTQTVIDVWYGDNQKFGNIGEAQVWANVLGNVSGPQAIDTLTYKLNGGSEKALTMGPDALRLADEGDFNIEINFDDLNVGANTVEIKAIDSDAAETTKTVTLDYTAGNDWPETYTADWSSSPNIQNIAQVVDGQWSIQNGVLKPLTYDYDRLVAIGDDSWQDYEITFQMNVHGIDTSGNNGPSNGSGVGLMMRWQGHDNIAGEQPSIGWENLGALAWYRWAPSGSEALELRAGSQGWIDSNTDKTLEFDVPYMVKASVQSVPDGSEGSFYRFKMWEAGTPEPTGWDMDGFGRADEPATGAMTIVSHHVDVTFGDVSIKPLDDIRFFVNATTSGTGTGTLQFTSPQPDDGYMYADRVGIWALPEPGTVFDGWTGDYTQPGSLLSFNITKDTNVTANFSPAPPANLDITEVGSGHVERDPEKPEYLYGEEVELTAVPDPDYLFFGWSGDLQGIENPIILTMTGDKDVTATFVHKSQASPTSDDFSYCGDLDTSLWTFINPGSGSKQLTGATLNLTVPAGTPHDLWTNNQDAPRILQDTLDQDFEVEVKFESIPDEAIQLQGILVQNDANNWLRFDFFHDGNTLRWHAGFMQNGTAGTKNIGAMNAGSNNNIYMRVTRNGNLWTQQYSFDGVNWEQGAQFTQALEVTQSGVFAGNATDTQNNTPQFIGIIDYFFNTGAPIEPEDGGSDGKKVINTETSGQGAINLSPNRPNGYSCGETVTVTAVAESEWEFSEWNGDLTGESNPKQITISKNHNIVAIFVEGGETEVFLPIIKRP